SRRRQSRAWNSICPEANTMAQPSASRIETRIDACRPERIKTSLIQLMQREEHQHESRCRRHECPRHGKLLDRLSLKSKKKMSEPIAVVRGGTLRQRSCVH